MAPFVDADHFVQNMGDGTFHHSGSLAVRAAVAAGVAHHLPAALQRRRRDDRRPGRRRRAADAGAHARAAAEGVARIIVTTEDRCAVPGVALAPRASTSGTGRATRRPSGCWPTTPGVTVLIHDQECAAEKRRKRKRGDGRRPEHARRSSTSASARAAATAGRTSNCLSVHAGRHRVRPQDPDPPGVVQQGLLLPRRRLPVVPDRRAGSRGEGTRSTARDGAASVDRSAPTLPEPPRWSTPTPSRVRLAGIGGTGVVDDRPGPRHGRDRSPGATCAALDQTGLAQKGGAVVSDLQDHAGPRSRPAGRAAEGECDLYLGCDLLVAAEPREPRHRRPGAHLSRPVDHEGADRAGWSSTRTVAFPDADAVRRRHRRPQPRRASPSTPGAAPRRCSATTSSPTSCSSASPSRAGALPMPGRGRSRRRSRSTASRSRPTSRRSGSGARSSPIRGAFAAALARRASRPHPAPRSSRRAAPPRRGSSPRSVRRPDRSWRGWSTFACPSSSPTRTLRYARAYADARRRVRAGRERRGAGLDGPRRDRRALPLQAHGLQGRVRGRAAVPRPGARRQRSAAEFGDGARYAYQLHPPVLRAMGLQRKITLGPVVPAGVPRAARDAAPARHAARPVRRDAVRRVERELVEEYDGPGRRPAP